MIAMGSIVRLGDVRMEPAEVDADSRGVDEDNAATARNFTDTVELFVPIKVTFATRLSVAF
jgi:hypothetical protein